MKKAWIAVLMGCVMIVSVARADEASHRETALKLLETAKTEKMLEHMMKSIEDMMEQQFKAVKLPPEAREEARTARKEIVDWMSEFFTWERMRGMYVDIYVDVFTEDELEELIAFYESPLGRKLIEKQPELMRKSMEQTQTILQDKMPELQQRMNKKVFELQEEYKEVEYPFSEPDSDDGQ